MHAEVEIADRAGTVARGYSYGPEWTYTRLGEAMCVVTIEPSDGPLVTVDVADVVTLEPVGGGLDRAGLVRGVERLVGAATQLPANEDQCLSMVLNQHSELEVRVRRIEYPCRPGIADAPWHTLPAPAADS